ncbi:MAG: tetratricopeptide repeat protein [Bryobacteraceae bacterium]|nr:tetratricopeptide repeat protein [Bryobacteraceae bacterium]
MPYLLILFVFSFHAFGQAPSYEAELEEGRKQLKVGNSSGADEIFSSVRERAIRSLSSSDAALAADKALILISRSRGDWKRTEELLNEALDFADRTRNPAESISLLSQLGAARRALGLSLEAIAALERAVALRGVHNLSPELARDYTTIGLLHMESGDAEKATGWFRSAVSLWVALMRDDPETLVALEALASIYRNVSDYEKAEPLYQRSLLIREIAFGPSSAEMLGVLDNLAYVYFGQKKYAEAEPLYARLLTIWEASAGPDHPMVALTLDKIFEFYVAQDRFDEATPLITRAVEIRAKAYLRGLRDRSRLAALQSNNTDAIDYASKAATFIDLAGLPKPEIKILPAPKNAKPVKRGKSLTNTK